MWSQISDFATRALALLGGRGEQEPRGGSLRREELQLAPGWAETSLMETAGNNTSPANLEFLAKRQTCPAGYGYCSSEFPFLLPKLNPD